MLAFDFDKKLANFCAKVNKVSKFIFATQSNKANSSDSYYFTVYHHYHHHQASSKNKMFSLNLIVIKVNRKERMNCVNNSENSCPTTLLVLVGR